MILIIQFKKAALNEGGFAYKVFDLYLLIKFYTVTQTQLCR